MEPAGAVSSAVVVLVSVIFICAVFGYIAVTDRDERIRALEDRTSRLRDELTATQEEYADYKLSSEKELNAKEFEISNKAMMMSQLEVKVANLEEDVDALTSEVQTWQDRYGRTHSELQLTEQELETARGELDDLYNLTSQVYKDLEDLIHWVEVNAYLPSGIWRDVHARCGDPMEKEGDTCYISTYGMGKFMDDCFGFSADEQRGDVQSITDCLTFWELGEGDCDDFSLFAAAWVRAELLRADHFCDETRVVLQDAPTESCDLGRCERVYLDVSPEDVYVVCGELKDGSGGHCEVGMAAHSPISLSSKDHLKALHMFDPQIGSYMGRASDEFEEDALQAIIALDDLVFYSGWEVDYMLSGIEGEYDEFVEEYGI